MARQPASAFMDVDFVKEQIERATIHAGQEFADNLHQEVWSQMSANHAQAGGPLEFDSPLEAAFWAWWLCMRAVYPHFTQTSLELQRHVEVNAGGARYVIDFVLVHNGRATPHGSDEVAGYAAARWPKIAIELDGHTFHEKTLEQVTYRNQRDRALQQDGWRVFHYSFDEFKREPAQCITEPIVFAGNVFYDLRRAFYAEKAGDQ